MKERLNRLLCLFFVVTLDITAQSETGRAVLAGTVSDQSGNAVASATVLIKEMQTGLQRTIKTNSEAYSAQPPCQLGSTHWKHHQQGLR